MVGGPSKCAIFGLDGKPMGVPCPKPISAFASARRLGGDGSLFGSQSLRPRDFAWYAYDRPSAAQRPVKTALRRPGLSGQWRHAGREVVREFATSKDGTKVPLNIIKGKAPSSTGRIRLLLRLWRLRHHR